MEDVLELYARKHDEREPVLCLDERPVVLHADSRAPLPMAPGRIARRDYEYVRGGTANIFCIVEPVTGRRLTYATANRKRAAFVRSLQKIERRYRGAKRIHLVMDNLNVHSQASAITVLGELAGRRLWRRFAVHFTPKHASWLNAAEIEASLVSRECLGRDRVVSLAQLISRVSAWRVATERAHRTIDWKFRVHDARRVFRYSGLKTARSEY
jgi:transposase